MTARAAVGLLMKLPGVDRCLVQLTEGEWPVKAAKNSGGGWDFGSEDLHAIRVGIGRSGAWHEAAASTLREAATSALTAHNLPVPAEFNE